MTQLAATLENAGITSFRFDFTGDMYNFLSPKTKHHYSITII